MKSFEIKFKEVLVKFDNREQIQSQLTYALFWSQDEVVKDFFMEIQYFLWRDEPDYLLKAMDIYQGATPEMKQKIEDNMDLAGFKYESDDE